MEQRLFIIACIMFAFYKASHWLMGRKDFVSRFNYWHTAYLLIILNAALYLILFVMSGGPGADFPFGKFAIGSLAILGYTIYSFFKNRLLDEKGQRPIIKESLEWCNTVYFAGFVASIVMFFFLQAFKIPSASMRDTIDTVKHEFYDEMMQRIQSVIDPKQIQIIISNHSELDHSGALIETVKTVCPDEVYVSAMGMKHIIAHFHQNLKLKTVKTGDRIDVGGDTISFVEARMLHWPDSMFSYLEKENILT